MRCVVYVRACVVCVRVIDEGHRALGEQSVLRWGAAPFPCHASPCCTLLSTPSYCCARLLATEAMTEAAYFSTGSVPASEWYACTFVCVRQSLCLYPCLGNQRPPSSHLLKPPRAHACAASTSARFHYGLGLQHYTHFTSPIRRYADVIVHRQLMASLALRPNETDAHLPSGVVGGGAGETGGIGSAAGVQAQRERGQGRESVCVCLCVCVSVGIRESMSLSHTHSHTHTHIHTHTYTHTHTHRPCTAGCRTERWPPPSDVCAHQRAQPLCKSRPARLRCSLPGPLHQAEVSCMHLCLHLCLPSCLCSPASSPFPLPTPPHLSLSHTLCHTTQKAGQRRGSACTRRCAARRCRRRRPLRPRLWTHDPRAV